MFLVSGYDRTTIFSNIYLMVGCAVQAIYSSVIKSGIVGSAKKLAKNSIGRSECYL